MDLDVDLPTRIRRWREAKGLTRQDLARAVGVTWPAVYQWEGEEGHVTSPSQENLAKVVEALGITMQQFWGKVPKGRAA